MYLKLPGMPGFVTDLFHPCLESFCSLEFLGIMFTVSAQRVNILLSLMINLYSSWSGGTWRIWSIIDLLLFICIDPSWKGWSFDIHWVSPRYPKMYLSQLKGTPAIWLKIKRRLSFGFGCDSPNKYNHPGGSIPLIYHLDIANWAIICYLPPIRGTGKLHWYNDPWLFGVCWGFYDLSLY